MNCVFVIGKLSNTTFAIDAQGTTETWTNGQSRCLMFHVAYKLAIGMNGPRHQY
ncbi:MAG: hypothetical protein PHU58_01500 [Prevotella sp.]|nr:hypothetical protein [Prevotella sp.]MDD3387137.1 hypothetical protein [Prevotella sp.]